MSIKLKDMINESTPGYENRKSGDPLPTLEDVQKAYNEKQSLNEEYVESMGPDFDNGLDLIMDAWKDWKNGPMTEPSHIKPAQKEVMKYIASWLKKNIK